MLADSSASLSLLLDITRLDELKSSSCIVV